MSVSELAKKTVSTLREEGVGRLLEKTKNYVGASLGGHGQKVVPLLAEGRCQQRRAGKCQQGSSAGKADTKDDAIKQRCPAQQHQPGAHGSGQHPAQCQCKQLPGMAAQNPQALHKRTAKAFAFQQKFW